MRPFFVSCAARRRARRRCSASGRRPPSASKSSWPRTARPDSRTVREEAGTDTAFGDHIPKEPNKRKPKRRAITQAAGHVPFGITDFKLTTIGSRRPRYAGAHWHRRPHPHRRRARPRDQPCRRPAVHGRRIRRNRSGPRHRASSPHRNAPQSDPQARSSARNEATVVRRPEAGDVPLSKARSTTSCRRAGLALGVRRRAQIPQPLSAGALKAAFKKAEEEGAVPGVGGFPTLGQQAGLEAGSTSPTR